MVNKNLEGFIEDLQKEKLRSRRKFLAISEMKGDKLFRLKVKKIYTLTDTLKNTYLMKVKNYEKPPKYRFFLAHSLASVSSDFLVSLAKDFAVKHHLKLIQYSLYPNHLRVSLLSLKELTEREQYSKIISLFKEFNGLMKERLTRLKKLIQ
jgi:hypothetical protein